MSNKVKTEDIKKKAEYTANIIYSEILRQGYTLARVAIRYCKASLIVASNGNIFEMPIFENETGAKEYGRELEDWLINRYSFKKVELESDVNMHVLEKRW